MGLGIVGARGSSESRIWSWGYWGISSILYFLALSEVRKEDLLQRLDRAVFDRGEIEELRTRANQYWGLKGSTEERIHSARWGAGAA